MDYKPIIIKLPSIALQDEHSGFSIVFLDTYPDNQIQNPFITAQSTQIKSVISVSIKDFIHHYPRALFNDIHRVSAHFYGIPGSGRTFTTYPGRDSLLRHTQVGAQFNEIPGSYPDIDSKGDK